MKSLFVYAAVLILVFVPVAVFAQVPFGGAVTFAVTCNSGLMLTVLQPTGPIQLMWFWGELPYLTHVAPHPGQLILGMAAVTPVPCIFGFYPIGYGLPILFHGSSI